MKPIYAENVSLVGNFDTILNNDPFIRDFVTLNKSVINYLPRCSYHLLYAHFFISNYTLPNSVYKYHGLPYGK